MCSVEDATLLLLVASFSVTASTGVGGASCALHTARARTFISGYMYLGVGLASRGNKQNAKCWYVHCICEMSSRGKIDVKIGEVQISSSFDSGNRL